MITQDVIHEVAGPETAVFMQKPLHVSQSKSTKFDETGKGVIICLIDWMTSDLWARVLSFGIRIKHKSNGIAISQSHYIEKVVSQLEYSRVIGFLMYDMTCKRPNIAFAIGKLSRSATLKTIHLQEAGYSCLVVVQFLGLPRNNMHHWFNIGSEFYGFSSCWEGSLMDEKLIKIDVPNITMEEYIRLEEEKARRRSQVSPLNNNKIDFRIPFDESEDEDYTVIFDKNSFSYKIISVNNLKTDSENDNDKVNMPSFLSSKPTVGYFDDLDYFKDFEKGFSAIVYNDALTSKLDFLTEPTISPQHIDEFDETSLSACNEEEQNVLFFNDLFPFNVIYPDDSKSDKDNDDDEIDIKQSWGMQYGVSLGLGYNVLTTCTDLAVKKSTIWYTLKKTCVELIRAF
ncbi:hypothetical protein Tco_0779155 [Tanacetum coccineum]